jgi:hypothetical protein
MSEQRERDGALFRGLLLGMFFGAVWGTLRGPRLRDSLATLAASRQRLNDAATQAGESLREKVETALPRDPVADGIAEGKAAARRRLAELGIAPNPPELP